MAVAGHPDYENYQRLTISELNKIPHIDLIHSYIIIHADFEFPVDTKFPSIACYVNETCTIFPLKGECVVTGAEYLLAVKQGCVFTFKDVNMIPFKKNVEGVVIKPFEFILKTVQEMRREYPKGTINNLMYKEIGNSIYGSVVRGIANKQKFDTKTRTTQRMKGDNLSNPIIAS